MQLAEDFLRRIREGAEASATGGVQLIGPLPAPMQRKSGRFRAQLLLGGKSRAAVRRTAERIVELAESLPEGKRLRWSVDIDPLEML